MDDCRVLRATGLVRRRRDLEPSPSYLAERFPTEVRATASGFCFHQGAIWGGFCSPIVTYFALYWHLGFAIPMAIGTIGVLISLLNAVLIYLTVAR